MAAIYDMCVDYELLCSIEDKLQKIGYDLQCSANEMNNSIQISQDFLAGNQFEKAKSITAACISLTNRTELNIQSAKKYINQLKNDLEEYSGCKYTGEA